MQEQGPASGKPQIVADGKFIRSHMGMRGVAALLVVAYHLQFGVQNPLPIEQSTQFFRRGYLWVDLFFILSGFIISYSSGFLERRPTWQAAQDFFRSRIARIVPLHWFCLAYVILFGMFTAVVDHLAGRALNPHWSFAGAGWTFLEAALLHSFFLNDQQMWNIPSWSISAEMVAYFLFPLIALMVRWRGSMAILLLLSVAFYIWVFRGDGNLDIISGLSPLRCLAGFVIGIALCRYRDIWQKLPVVLIGLIQVTATTAILWGLHIKLSDPLLILPFALLIGSTCHDKGPIARILALRPFQKLGDISYSVYLNHTGVIGIIYFFWIRMIGRLGLPADVERIAWIMIALSSVIVFSMATHRLVEKPARRWLSRRWAAKSAAQPPLSGTR
jgi:peptidoglycan/LPS O-acetylase OafA/YrhL